MNDDDRLSRYLADQAEAITLAPADLGAAMRRGTHRRNRRRGAIVAGATLAIVATSLSVIDRGDPDASVDSDLAAAVVPSSLDWTVVSPTSGLGYSRSTTLVGGVTYSLSTAPGPNDETTSSETHLYRSDDGAEWAEVALPDGVRPSSLAGSGDTLYAIGTAPASGGGRDLVVSASTDGAATWSSVTLPDAVAALEARHPGEIIISQPDVAATDATHLVASVVVTANPDVETLLPDDASPNGGWSISADGVSVYEELPCDAASGEQANDCADPAITRSSEATAPMPNGPSKPEVKATYTWDELGLDPELRGLIGGRTYVYASDDGVTFDPATLPGDVGGWSGGLLATDDGYRLFLGQEVRESDATTLVLASEDGHTWTRAGSLPGSPVSAGLLGGRPALAVYTVDGSFAVQISQPDGSWVPLDLLAAVGGSGGVQDVAFGPLGLAATVWQEGDPMASYIVHSADGTTVSAVALADHLDASTSVIGLSVSADAIVVRVADPKGATGSTPTQHDLVGTPR